MDARIESARIGMSMEMSEVWTLLIGLQTALSRGVEDWPDEESKNNARDLHDRLYKMMNQIKQVGFA